MSARLPLAALALLLAFLLGCGGAQGHALYYTSAPRASEILTEAPQSVVISLTEPASPGSPTILVTDSSDARVDVNGTRISSGDARVISTDLQTLPPGLYTVQWLAVSAVDGHPSSSSFSFAIQDANGTIPDIPGITGTGETPPSPIDVVLRFATFFSMAACVGAAAFLAFVWDPASQDLPAKLAPSSRRARDRLLLWGAGNAAGMAAYTAAWFANSLISVPTQDAGAAIRGSVFYQSLIARLGVGLALAAFFSYFLLRRRRDDAFELPRGASMVAFVLGLAAVGAGSAASHSAARADTGVVGVASDFAHSVFVCTWVGGLVALVVSSPSLRGAKNALLARRSLTRFSMLALASVIGVIAAGGLLALIEVAGPANLLGTTFGNVVLAKILLVVPMVALGAHNRFTSIPFLKDPERVVESAARVLRNVKLEAALGTCVLVLAGLLTALVPSTSLGIEPPAPALFDVEQTKDGLRIELIIFPVPDRPGPNYTVSVQLWYPSNSSAYLNGTNVTVTFNLVNSTTSPQAVDFDGPHGNHFFTNALVFTKAGTWRLDVLVRRTDGFDVRVSFNVLIKEAT